MPWPGAWIANRRRQNKQPATTVAGVQQVDARAYTHAYVQTLRQGVWIPPRSLTKDCRISNMALLCRIMCAPHPSLRGQGEERIGWFVRVFGRGEVLDSFTNPATSTGLTGSWPVALLYSRPASERLRRTLSSVVCLQAKEVLRVELVVCKLLYMIVLARLGPSLWHYDYTVLLTVLLAQTRESASCSQGHISATAGHWAMKLVQHVPTSVTF